MLEVINSEFLLLFSLGHLLFGKQN